MKDSYKCWNCLIDLEEKSDSSEWENEKTALKYWYEMARKEKELITEKLNDIKPKTVLEIGSGAGRVIEILLKNSKAQITSLENSPKMYPLVRERFQGNTRVKIIFGKMDSGSFDLALCMMKAG